MNGKNTIKLQLVVAFFAILVAAAPHAEAGMAVKFFGTAQAVPADRDAPIETFVD